MPRGQRHFLDRLIVCGALGFLAALAGCGERSLQHAAAREVAQVAWPHELMPAADVPIVTPSSQARAWLQAGQLALEHPALVELPHAEWGGFRASQPSARAIAFTAGEGQVLEVELARPSAEAEAPEFGPVEVQLFLLDASGAEERQVPLAVLAADESTLRFRLPEPATYIVRLRPAPMTDTMYYLQIELGAVLPSPVRGYTASSFFGASRDSGKRHHEGVDIFAPRRTPVIAVADGRALYRSNKLGGHSIWINTPGVSYYYAHLERVAVGGGQRVHAGDIVGYVGDSGNASSVGTHLHFGIYRWGKEPIDPLPLLEERRFTEPPVAAFEPVDNVTVFEPGERRAQQRPKCSARFPDSMSTLRICLAAELAAPHPAAVERAGDCDRISAAIAAGKLPCLDLGGRSSAPPLELIAAATLPVELAPRSAVLELAGDGIEPATLACNAASAGLPGVCTPQVRRTMVF